MWVPCFLAWTPVSFPSASTPAQVASLSRVAPYSFPSPSQSVEEDPDRSCTNESGKENRIRFSLYVTGFPYGTVGCHALENDLHQYFSSFAPVENVTVLSNPENGWVLCAYANFVHEIYAQAVLNAAPFGSFYGLYLSIEPARGPRTLRFSSFNHENVINISAYLEHDAPSRCASFLRRYAKSDRDATRAALSVKVGHPSHEACSGYCGVLWAHSVRLRNALRS